ncbi:hypothetical protein [Geoglobus sp.]
MTVPLTGRDYSIIIEAINRASIFSTQEKKEVKEKINQMKLNRLSESEQGELVLKILAALQDYTMQFKGVKLKDLIESNSKDKSITIQWTPGDHITLTEYSLLSLKNVFKKNIPDSRINTISEAADDPDYPPWNNYDHHGSLAVYNVEQLAELAEIYYSNGNIQAGDETLGKATHYMCDLGNPWHAVGLLNQDLVTHVMYEDWVHNRIRNGWYDYLANLNWIVISSPSTLANDLKDIAASKYERLHWIMISDPNWENNLELQVTTSMLLEETVAHNMGLIEYAID